MNLSRLSRRDPVSARLRTVPISKQRNMHTEIKKFIELTKRIRRTNQRMSTRSNKLAEAASVGKPIQRSLMKLKKNINKHERLESYMNRLQNGLLKKYENFMNIPANNLEKTLKKSINEYRRVTSGARERTGR